MLSSRIAILGAGSVGSAVAFSLILNPVASEILLVDPKVEMRDAQVEDLSDARWVCAIFLIPATILEATDGHIGRNSLFVAEEIKKTGLTSFVTLPLISKTYLNCPTTVPKANNLIPSLSGVRIRAGSHNEAGQSSIVIITAGAKQRPGEARTDLLSRNLSILRSAIEDMKPFHDDTVILLVANPVDILTYFAQQISGLPKGQVIGSGTFLDSTRLRGLLAREIDVDPSSIHASVVGEHGDTQLVTWSTITIGGVPLAKALPTPSINIDEDAVAAETRDKASKIIKAKGATAYGIGSITASLCKSILFDEHRVRPVSHWNEGFRCCISLPVVLGRKGIVRELGISITEKEKALLDKSAKTLRGLITMTAETDWNG
jgi:L-lactate dehydrogenase